MKRTDSIRKITSWAEAEARERDHYRSLTPEARLQIALELIERAYGPRAAWRPVRECEPRKLNEFIPTNRHLP